MGKTLKKMITDRMSETTKNKIKKFLGKEVENPLDSEEKILKRCEKLARRKLDVKISGNISYERPLAFETAVKDLYYEELLRSKHFTFETPEVILNPYKLTPLCALILFYTEAETAVKVLVKGDSEAENVEYELEAEQYHRVPVMGLYGGRENIVVLELKNKAGKTLETKEIQIATEELPEVLKDIVSVRKKDAVSAHNLFFVMGGGEVMPFAFDQRGNVRYYLKRYPKGYGIFLMTKGHILFPEKDILAQGYENPHSAQVHDMDLLGRVFKTYHLEEGLHHDACEMESGGNILCASSSLLDQCEDRVLEIDRKTGKKVSKLDTCEIVESKYHDQKDWSHVNTVQYLEKEGCVLICMRNLHSVAKVDWKTKKLLWVMGDPRFWEDTPVMKDLLQPVGEVPFHFQSHTARILSEDLDGNPDTYHMIIFDNHWHKRRSVSFFDNDPDSFVNIYTINEKERTVRLFKQYRCPKSKIRSNAELVLEKNRIFAMEGNLEPAIDEYLGLIEEFDYESGEVLNQYLIRKGFYRAWGAEFDYGELSSPMTVDTGYFVSELKALEKIDDFTEIASGYPEETVPEEETVKYKRSEDMLFIYAKDHMIRHVYLVGDKHVYHKDFSKTKQGKKVFAERYYYVIVPLAGMEPDQYRICIDYDGKLYDSQKNFKVIAKEAAADQTTSEA